MRLGFFTMPMHPPHRRWVETLKEDRASFILADKLGFYDAFCGEHIADVIENVTNSFQFLATLIPETKQIKLATGTANLSQTHPVLIAAHAAMFDHLSEGRFVLGISAGALPADAELLGHLNEDRARIFHEAVDALFALWTTDAPYNFDKPDNRFKISSAKMGRAEFGLGAVAKPYQKPYPEIVGTVVAPSSSSATFFGQKGIHPLSANFLLPQWLKSHWDAYAEGARSARPSTATIGASPAPSLWPMTTRWRRAMRSRTPTARTGSTTSTCCASSAWPSGSRVSSTRPISQTRKSPTIMWSTVWSSTARSTRWWMKFWRFTRRPVRSANWSTLAWIGSIPR